MEHFFPQIQVKAEKKRFSPTMEHFFPQIQVDTFAQMHTRVKLLGGDAGVDHTQIIGGIYPPTSGFWHPCLHVWVATKPIELKGKNVQKRLRKYYVLSRPLQKFLDSLGPTR